VSRRSASKAEIFEGALARVSGSLARVARAAAATLRAERLAAARSPARPASTPEPTPAPPKKAAAALAEEAVHRTEGGRLGASLERPSPSQTRRSMITDPA
jgi:hypothetical protein